MNLCLSLFSLSLLRVKNAAERTPYILIFSISLMIPKRFADWDTLPYHNNEWHSISNLDLNYLYRAQATADINDRNNDFKAFIHQTHRSCTYTIIMLTQWVNHYCMVPLSLMQFKLSRYKKYVYCISKILVLMRNVTKDISILHVTSYTHRHSAYRHAHRWVDVSKYKYCYVRHYVMHIRMNLLQVVI